MNDIKNYTQCEIWWKWKCGLNVYSEKNINKFWTKCPYTIVEKHPVSPIQSNCTPKIEIQLQDVHFCLKLLKELLVFVVCYWIFQGGY